MAPRCTRVLRLTLILLAMGIFLLVQLLAFYYHKATYALVQFDAMEREYMDNITQEILNHGQSGRDQSGLQHRTQLIGSLYRQLQELKQSPYHHRDSAKRMINSVSDSRSEVVKVMKPQVEIHALFTRYNLSELSHRLSMAVDGDNLNDRILQFHLTQVWRIDNFLLSNYTPNWIESQIDSRRGQGYLTNLKLSEFRGITRLLHGARLCHPTDYGASLTTVMFIITKPDDFEIRSLIRQTWGAAFQAPNSTTRLYFVFGILPANHPRRHLCTEEVGQESKLFGDIIQWEFEEDYFRLTVKSVALLRWASVYCACVPSIYKVDADQIVNYANLVRFTRKLLTNENLVKEFSAFGNIWTRAKVLRTHKSKYYTSFYDYPDKFYPPYAGSAWYLFGESQPLLMYAAAIYQTMPAILWEDVYITGILGQKLLASHLPYHRYHMPGFDWMTELTKLDGCLFRSRIIMTEVIKPSNLVNTWQRIQAYKSFQYDPKCELELKIEPVF